MAHWPIDTLQTLFDIRHPIIQGGMVYNSGAELAAAVSEAGGLGLIAAGWLRPEELREHIRRARELTDRPIGVNLPLFFKHAPDAMQVALDEDIRIFFTSAGSPKRVAGPMKEAGCRWAHVVAAPTLALKCQEAGCDAVVCEGFEAGGHNGREELTTMVLVPLCAAAVDIPVIAAGGIATGAQMAAAMALGAAGVQIGSRFAVTGESAGHDAYKRAVVEGDDTMLVLKSHMPVRLMRNAFRETVQAAEARGAGRAELTELLGTGRARRGMLEGDLEDGELEIGQVAALIDDVLTVAEVFTRLLDDFTAAAARLGG